MDIPHFYYGPEIILEAIEKISKTAIEERITFSHLTVYKITFWRLNYEATIDLIIKRFKTLKKLSLIGFMLPLDEIASFNENITEFSAFGEDLELWRFSNSELPHRSLFTVPYAFQTFPNLQKLVIEMRSNGVLPELSRCLVEIAAYDTKKSLKSLRWIYLGFKELNLDAFTKKIWTLFNLFQCFDVIQNEFSTAVSFYIGTLSGPVLSKDKWENAKIVSEGKVFIPKLDFGSEADANSKVDEHANGVLDGLAVISKKLEKYKRHWEPLKQKLGQALVEYKRKNGSLEAKEKVENILKEWYM